MFIRDSRRSYRAYSYAGLILITDLFSFGTPVGVTELILCGSTCKYYKTYTGLADTRVPLGTTGLVLQNLDMYFRFYTCLTERILIYRT